MFEIEDTGVTRRSVLGLAGSALLGLGFVTGSAAAKSEPPKVKAVAYGGRETVFSDQQIELSPELFDVRGAKVTGRGRITHHELPFADGKPYVLRLDPATGRYTERGAVINFDGPARLWQEEGKWRAVVREEVQPTQTGAFGWSVTRVDFFERPGMQYAESVIIVVWNADLFEYPDDGVIENVVGNYQHKGTANPGGN